MNEKTINHNLNPNKLKVMLERNKMEKSYEKIIVLGNGFDIHLGLPTKWSDFVDFYDSTKEFKIKDVIDSKNDDWDFANFKNQHSKWTNDNIRKCISKIYITRGNDENYKNDVIEFLEKIKKCKMLEFCSRMKVSEKSGWNNFEHLIESILNYIDEYVDNIINKPYTADSSVFMNEDLRLIIECLQYNDDKYFGKNITISNINLRTDVELNKKNFLNVFFNEILYFTDCYRQYIDLIVDWIINEDDNQNIIHNNEGILLLNFNYTQDSIYFKEISDENVLYVHGKVDNKIIIGISNNQQKQERIRFSKEYIRIYNRAISKNALINNIYKELEKQNFIHCYIIGHSLDTIDHSLLRLIYSKYLIKTTIFYYSEEDKDNKLFNLYLLLKEENMNHLLNDNLLELVNISDIWTYDFCKD